MSNCRPLKVKNRLFVLSVPASSNGITNFQWAPDIVGVLVATLLDEIALVVYPKLKPSQVGTQRGEADADAAVKGEDRDLKVLDLDAGLHNAPCAYHFHRMRHVAKLI